MVVVSVSVDMEVMVLFYECQQDLQRLLYCSSVRNLEMTYIVSVSVTELIAVAVAEIVVEG